jgi:hypothetical protein
MHRKSKFSKTLKFVGCFAATVWEIFATAAVRTPILLNPQLEFFSLKYLASSSSPLKASSQTIKYTKGWTYFICAFPEYAFWVARMMDVSVIMLPPQLSMSSEGNAATDQRASSSSRYRYLSSNLKPNHCCDEHSEYPEIQLAEQ